MSPLHLHVAQSTGPAQGWTSPASDTSIACTMESTRTSSTATDHGPTRMSWSDSTHAEHSLIARMRRMPPNNERSQKHARTMRAALAALTLRATCTTDQFLIIISFSFSFLCSENTNTTALLPL